MLGVKTGEGGIQALVVGGQVVVLSQQVCQGGGQAVVVRGKTVVVGQH